MLGIVRRLRPSIAFLVIASVLGCGNERLLPTHPVSGQLTLDGKPVAGAEIWLVPQSPRVRDASLTVRPYGRTAADGTFTVTSYVENDGAPAGDYVVIVQKSQGNAVDPDDPDADPETPSASKRPRSFAATVAVRNRSQFPAKYGSAKTSGIAFAVQEGANRIELNLKSK